MTEVAHELHLDAAFEAAVASDAASQAPRSPLAERADAAAAPAVEGS